MQPTSARAHNHLLARGFEHRKLGPLRQQAKHLESLRGAALVVDRYNLPPNYLRRWSRSGRPCMQIVDGPEVLAGVRIAVNQNLDGVIEPRQGLKTFCGLQFALMRKEFRLATPIDCTVPPKRCLLTLGAADPEGHSMALVGALAALIRRRGMTLVLVVGAQNSRAELLHAHAASLPWLEFHYDVSDMASLMAGCQVAVSAAGSTLWELCSIGLPRLVVSIAPNQRPLAAAAAAAKVAIDCGTMSELSTQSLLASLDHLLDSLEARQGQAQAGRALIDGQGAARVAQALSEEL
jgi:UDP-2,4-diacetamido-2,4,6-trideoxy-beta-L-altropyranose hydrolase